MLLFCEISDERLEAKLQDLGNGVSSIKVGNWVLAFRPRWKTST